MCFDNNLFSTRVDLTGTRRFEPDGGWRPRSKRLDDEQELSTRCSLASLLAGKFFLICFKRPSIHGTHIINDYWYRFLERFNSILRHSPIQKNLLFKRTASTRSALKAVSRESITSVAPERDVATSRDRTASYTARRAS